MKKWELDVPVIFIIFNRPDIAARVFDKISEARPRQLFVVCDGPRIGREGEAEQVDNTREIIRNIDWECELYTNFSETNMGCDKRIEIGITWAFQYVDRAIILEDDCLPSPDFFSFCREMLRSYELNEEIAYISGTTFIKNYKTPYSYFFSYLASTWGWATWKSRWDKYEYGTEEFEQKKQKYLKDVYTQENRKNFLEDVERHFSQGSYPWDYIWQISMEGKLRIVPAENLICNIGFIKNSTHTLMKPKGYYAGLGTLKLPLCGPEEIEHDKDYSDEFQRKTKYYIWDRIIGKCKYLMLTYFGMR